MLKVLFCLQTMIFHCRVERIIREINDSIRDGALVITLSLKKIPLVQSRFTALTGLLVSK